MRCFVVQGSGFRVHDSRLKLYSVESLAEHAQVIGIRASGFRDGAYLPELEV